jgi:MerR family redox-sensitive transcriptional activator SoxR
MLTIGQVAQRSGVAPSALRFYEAEGLIASERTDGNQRRYQRRAAPGRRDPGRALRRHPLAAIGQALALLPADRPPSKRDWARLSRAWRRDVEGASRCSSACATTLHPASAAAASLRSCRLFNPTDRAAQAGAGARYLLGDEPPRDILAR